jgi:hypothetical protein
MSTAAVGFEGERELMGLYTRIRRTCLLTAMLGAGAIALSQQIELQSASELTISASEKRQIQQEVAGSPMTTDRAIFVDTSSLSKKGQILVVTLDRQHCMTVSIFSRRREQLEKVWSIDRLPVGAPICTRGASCPAPVASVTAGTVTISYATEDPNGKGCTISRVRYDARNQPHER